jgi:hypothetical protein
MMEIKMTRIGVSEADEFKSEPELDDFGSSLERS